MEQYHVTVEINMLVDLPIKAESMEKAIEEGRKLLPSSIVKLKKKSHGIQDWDLRDVVSVWK